MAQALVLETGPTLPTSPLALPVQDLLPAALLPRVLQLLLGTMFLKVASTETHMATRLPVADRLVVLEEAVTDDGLRESTSQDLPTHV
jgi:hypothetical protein